MQSYFNVFGIDISLVYTAVLKKCGYMQTVFSAVGVMTRLRAGESRNRGLIPCGDEKLLCCQKSPDRLWGPPSFLLNR